MLIVNFMAGLLLGCYRESLVLAWHFGSLEDYWVLEGSAVQVLTRCAGVVAVVLGLAMGVTAQAHADPDNPADPNPYPDVQRTWKYQKIDFEPYLRDGDTGAWFSTPLGLNCAIWDDGSFGCNGSFPGAPAGTNQVSWFPGDWQAHFDTTNELLFTPETAPPVLPPKKYIAYRAVRCAVAPDNGVYCFRGHSANSRNGDQFYITPTQSWLGMWHP